jgi:hypothetical protein
MFPDPTVQPSIWHWKYQGTTLMADRALEGLRTMVLKHPAFPLMPFVSEIMWQIIGLGSARGNFEDKIEFGALI